MTVAFQSMEPTVLKQIKRGNMKLKHFDKMQKHFFDKGYEVMLVTDIRGKNFIKNHKNNQIYYHLVKEGL